MLISRTPYRFSLYGGGLDYPGWYKKNNTRVLCAGLDYYCYQSVRELPPFFDHNYRICYSRIELAKNLDDINHPSAREVIRKFGENKSLEVNYVGDLPARSGIGSSSAFTVGLISSLCALNGKFLGRSLLANSAIDLEQGPMQENVGFQDQCASAFGGIIIIEANGSKVSPRRFITTKHYEEYITSSLLMGFDGLERNSQICSSKISKSVSSVSNDQLMKELTYFSNKGIDAFSEEADITTHAQITKKCRDLKLKLNGEENNIRQNEIIKKTEMAGSLCTRIMGAGGGGFFVCWAPKEIHNEIKNSVDISTWVDVSFSDTGSQIIFNA